MSAVLTEYACHKRVMAGAIHGFNEALKEVHVNGERVHVPDNFFNRGTPANGDYLVRYEDGYLSWSPKAVFEEGYKLTSLPSGCTIRQYAEDELVAECMREAIDQEKARIIAKKGRSLWRKLFPFRIVRITTP